MYVRLLLFDLRHQHTHTQITNKPHRDAHIVKQFLLITGYFS